MLLESPILKTFSKTDHSGNNRHWNRNNSNTAKYVTTYPKYTEEATTKINDIDINKYKTHDVIDSPNELCAEIQLLQSYQM